MADSLIVYRNPLEKAIWESMSDGPTVLMVVTFVVVAVFLSWGLLTMSNKMFKSHSNAMNVAVVVSIMVSCVVAFFACTWVYAHVV